MVETFSEDAARECIDWFSDFLGSRWLDEELELRRQRCQAIGSWVPSHVHGNPIIDGLARHQVNLAQMPFVDAVSQPTGEAVLEMAANVRHVATQIDGSKTKALRDLLRKKANARGYLYQCKVAAHYIRDGYKIVDFSIGERRGGDIVVTDSRVTVEIQCKALDPGSGRRIANPIFERIAAAILNQAERIRWRGEIGFVCDVDLKLDASRKLATEITRRMGLPGAHEFRVGDVVACVTPTELLIPWDRVNHLLEDPTRDRLRRPHIALLGNRAEPIGVRVLLAGISAVNDKVIGKMLTAANAAAEQLEGLYPGIVCVHTPEEIDWRRVSENGFLNFCVTAGFKHLGATPVAALAFTSERGDRTAYVYRNPDGIPVLGAGFRVMGIPFASVGS